MYAVLAIVFRITGRIFDMSGIIGSLMVCAVSGICGAAVYIAACLVMKIDVFMEMINNFRRR